MWLVEWHPTVSWFTYSLCLGTWLWLQCDWHAGCWLQPSLPWPHSQQYAVDDREAVCE